jgi:hypothetical protein
MRALALLPALAACADDVAQHEVTAPGELLTEDGRLREPGWSTRQLQRWDATRVHDPTQLRQWDFFTIANDDVAVNLTLVDLGFLKVGTVGVVDLATGEIAESQLVAGGSDTMTLSSCIPSNTCVLVGGSASLVEAGATAPALAFTADGAGWQITLDIPSTAIGGAVQGAIAVTRREAMPYLSLATPFREDPHLFFYEQKIPGMTAEGDITIDGRTFSLAGATAVLDWGRGAWPATATWYWAAASGTADGAPVAFNLGHGFGDPAAGSENIAFHDDVAHKLAAVEWTFDPDDVLSDWTFEAPDGRASLVLHPVASEIGGLDFGSVFSRLRKAYGTFSGTLVLDDGRVVTLAGVPGFAERMELSW